MEGKITCFWSLQHQQHDVQLTKKGPAIRLARLAAASCSFGMAASKSLLLQLTVLRDMVIAAH
jgi:hypothetical protein